MAGGGEGGGENLTREAKFSAGNGRQVHPRAHRVDDGEVAVRARVGLVVAARWGIEGREGGGGAAALTGLGTLGAVTEPVGHAGRRALPVVRGQHQPIMQTQEEERTN